MAVDTIARGLTASLIGGDGRLAPEKMPVISGVAEAEKFTPVGNITSPAQLEGKTAEEILLAMLLGLNNPTFVNPSLSGELHAATGIVGKAQTFTGTLDFNRGQITPAYGTSGYRAGAATGYFVNEVPMESADFAIELTPAYGENEILCRVAYAAGEQPKNSLGQDYEAPLPAGSVSIVLVIQGKYQIYDANLNEIDFIQEEDTDGAYYMIATGTEATGTKQAFAFPSILNLTGIKQFNPMMQSWDWIGGSAEASLKTFDMTTMIQDSNEYNVYTHNGSKRDERQLKLYFTVS